jgi:hypothetical protein
MCPFQSQGRRRDKLRKSKKRSQCVVSVLVDLQQGPTTAMHSQDDHRTHDVLKLYRDHTHSVSRTRFASASAAGEQMSEHTASNPQKYRVCMFPVREHSRPFGLVADQLRNLW